MIGYLLLRRGQPVSTMSFQQIIASAVLPVIGTGLESWVALLP
jgi:hypothetical protein